MGHEPHNRLVNRIFERYLRAAAEQWARGRLLDIGCGTKPYSGMFASHVDEHLGLDQPDGPHGTAAADLLGTAYAIPSADASFDTVLCTFVIEHLEEPQQALREAHRVLRPGGSAIYGAPFIWHLHEEPRDFFRYSKYGLEHLFVQAGFTIESIQPMGGFWVTSGQSLVYYLMRFNRGWLRRLRVMSGIGCIIQGLAGLLDRVDRAEDWSWAYLVVATRPT